MVLSTFLKHTISNFFRSNGLDIALFDNETHFFHYFPDDFEQKRVFLKTSCSLGDSPSDPGATLTSYDQKKKTSKPTNLIRNEYIQFTATTRFLFFPPRGREVRGEDFGSSRTNLFDIFWPKSKKGPIGLSRIGLSRTGLNRMGLTRKNPLARSRIGPSRARPSITSQRESGTGGVAGATPHALPVLGGRRARMPGEPLARMRTQEK